MASNTAPIFVLSPNVAVMTIVPADTTSLKTLFTPGANGSLLTDLNVVSDDTALVDLDLYLTVSATNYRIGTIPVAIGAGVTAASNAVNGLDPTKIPGLAADGTLWLPSGTVLKGAAKATVTAAKTVTIVAFGGDY